MTRPVGTAIQAEGRTPAISVTPRKCLGRYLGAVVLAWVALAATANGAIGGVVTITRIVFGLSMFATLAGNVIPIAQWGRPSASDRSSTPPPSKTFFGSWRFRGNAMKYWLGRCWQ
jgi:hypothetical protein